MGEAIPSSFQQVLTQGSPSRRVSAAPDVGCPFPTSVGFSIYAISSPAPIIAPIPAMAMASRMLKILRASALMALAGLAVAEEPLPDGVVQSSVSPAASLTPAQLAAIAEIEKSLVPIKGECFDMGKTSRRVIQHIDTLKMRKKAEPRGRVCVKDFLIAATEATQSQWSALMSGNPSYFRRCGATCPVENVSWDDVQVFLRALNAASGGRYRLPTEAEWEFAARGRRSTDFSNGECISSVEANFDGRFDLIECDPRAPEDPSRTRGKPLPVASFAPNRYGLHDVHGNVAEWTQDCWNMSVKEGIPGNDAVISGDCSLRGLRGGGWSNPQLAVRSAARSQAAAAARLPSVGFRLVRDISRDGGAAARQ